MNFPDCDGLPVYGWAITDDEGPNIDALMLSSGAILKRQA